MTDSEKELRRLAEAVRRLQKTRGLIHQGFPEVHDYIVASTPDAVLALLDRIEALERQAREAERKGAEEMRRAAAKAARAESDWIVGGSIATRIEDIPLPGDAP